MLRPRGLERQEAVIHRVLSVRPTLHSGDGPAIMEASLAPVPQRDRADGETNSGPGRRSEFGPSQATVPATGEPPGRRTPGHAGGAS